MAEDALSQGLSARVPPTVRGVGPIPVFSTGRDLRRRRGSPGAIGE